VLVLCRVLLWRELLSVTRNPADVAGRCLIFTWLAVFVGLIFYNLPTSVDALRSRMNVLFVEPVILLLMPYVYMSLFTSDKQYFIQGTACVVISLCISSQTVPACICRSRTSLLAHKQQTAKTSSRFHMCEPVSVYGPSLG
jgi:hypothetical protein